MCVVVRSAFSGAITLPRRLVQCGSLRRFCTTACGRVRCLRFHLSNRPPVSLRFHPPAAQSLGVFSTELTGHCKWLPRDGSRASHRPTFTDQEALLFHSQGRPGKLEVVATKPMATQRDLSLAYSPGVAVPVLAIAEDEALAYDYTTKGNFVAVITNGTAILGLGNRGALAAKPVMEGKSVLFKRFADIDSIDLEVSTEDPDEFINCVKLLGKGWGGINLEDIKAPECFIIEQKLRELLDIPVFHDDQHGTAIIAAAGLINALELTGREIKTTKLVCNGAGAAGIACLELLRAIGFRPENLILCDTKGVIYEGRTEGMNQWKSGFAVKTKARTLAEALAGADVFFGLSVKGAVTQGHGEVHGGQADHLRHGQSRSRNHGRGSRRSAHPTPSWPPAAPTIRTRSTMCWAFPTFSAARSTCAPAPSTWK